MDLAWSLPPVFSAAGLRLMAHTEWPLQRRPGETQSATPDLPLVVPAAPLVMFEPESG